MILDRDEFYLRCCPYMIGINEAWVIEKEIFVSPAIFQLLTDDQDLHTMRCVARQLNVRQALRSELDALARSREAVAMPPAKRELSAFISNFRSFF